MAKKTIFVAASHGIILNAAAMGAKADIHVGPHEPVEVPLAYGEHLISDRFVVEVDEPKGDPKSDKAKKAAADKITAEKEAAEKAAADLLAAQNAVSSAEAALAAAGDDAAKAEAEKNLSNARAALDALKA